MSDDLAIVEQATVYTPQAGDVVVLEVPADFTMSRADNLKQQATRLFGREVRVVVLAGAHFAGVVRD